MIDTLQHVLESAGYRCDEDGGAALTGAARRLFDGWTVLIRGLLRPYADEAHDGPALIASDVLDAAGYIENFPHQVVPATDDGRPAYRTPAACFHVYPRLSGRCLEGAPFSAIVTACCTRRESTGAHGPFRLSRFHMVELVVVGARDAVEKRRAEVQDLTDRTLATLCLAGAFEPATDAFFMGGNAGARLIQQLKELKREYVVTAGGDRVAVASSNYHEDYFGRRFSIRDTGDRPASSFCAAFGIERLTAAGLVIWGPSPDGWPEELRR
jgi:seryl-tRNA synthetase